MPSEDDKKNPSFTSARNAFEGNLSPEEKQDAQKAMQANIAAPAVKKWPTVDTSKNSKGSFDPQTAFGAPKPTEETPKKTYKWTIPEGGLPKEVETGVKKAVETTGKALDAVVQESSTPEFQDALKQQGLTTQEIAELQKALKDAKKEQDTLLKSINESGGKLTQDQLNAAHKFLIAFFGDGATKADGSFANGRLGTVINKLKIDTAEGAMMTSLVIIQESFGVIKDLITSGLAANRNAIASDKAFNANLDKLGDLNGRIDRLLAKLNEGKAQEPTQIKPIETPKESPLPPTSQTKTPGKFDDVLKEFKEKLEEGKGKPNEDGKEDLMNIARTNGGYPPTGTKDAAKILKDVGATIPPDKGNTNNPLLKTQTVPTPGNVRGQ